MDKAEFMWGKNDSYQYKMCLKIIGLYDLFSQVVLWYLIFNKRAVVSKKETYISFSCCPPLWGGKAVKLHPSSNWTTAMFHGFCLAEMMNQFIRSQCSFQSPTSVQLLKCTAIHMKSHVSQNTKLYFRKHPHERWHWSGPLKVCTFS